MGSRPLERAQRCAFTNQGKSITAPADSEGIDSANIVDGESVEEVATERQARVAAGEQQLQSRTKAEGAVELGSIV